LDKEVFLKYATWEEFHKYVREYGLEGKIPYIFEKIRDEDLLTPSDVAELTGYSDETIRRWCRSWKLKTITGRPPYNIRGIDLKEYLYTWTRKDLIKKGEQLIFYNETF